MCNLLSHFWFLSFIHLIDLQEKCDLRHPPGNEIYRKGTISFFEIDGRKNKVGILLMFVRWKVIIFFTSIDYLDNDHRWKGV